MSNEYLADLCDKLLGVDRNDALTMRVTKKVSYYHADVCKDFLVGFCPHLAFSNTKSDLGPCAKRFHEDSLKEQFIADGERGRERYEVDFFENLHRIILELQRKIKRAQSRLETKASEEVEQLLNPEKDEYEEKRAILDVQMKTLIRKMEEYAEKGRMKEVQDVNAQLEMLRAEVCRIKSVEESNPLVKQERKMEVCQVCGSFLVMNDIQKRLEAHFEGKQHLGYQKVWEYYEVYKKRYPEVYQRIEGGQRRGPQQPGRPFSRDRYSGFGDGRAHASSDRPHSRYPHHGHGRSDDRYEDRRSDHGGYPRDGHTKRH